jgi:hypothetical protein
MRIRFQSLAKRAWRSGEVYTHTYTYHTHTVI